VLLLPGSRSRRSVSFHTGPHAPRHTDVPTTLRLAPPLLRGAMVHRTSGAGPPSCASSAETISTATTRACSPFTPVPWRLLERFPGSGSRREDMRCAELSCVAACQALVRVPSRCGTPKEVYQPSLCRSIPVQNPPSKERDFLLRTVRIFESCTPEYTQGRRGEGRVAPRRVGVVRAWEWVREVSERGGEGEGGIEET